MKEIVDRLQEKRNIELAKSILESAGYRVSKKSSRRLEEAYKYISLKSLDKETIDNYNSDHSSYSRYASDMLLLKPASIEDTGWVRELSTDSSARIYTREVRGKAYMIAQIYSGYRCQVWDGDTYEDLGGTYRRKFDTVFEGEPTYSKAVRRAEEQLNLPKTSKKVGF